ncbi:MAG TPA: efflux transporter outer membrane subunit [Puia sp.]|nr:efflux transporter outer membrane subunit [Puia sp.]
MASKIKIVKWSLLLMVSGLGACKLGKDYQRPEIASPAQFRMVSTSDTSSIANIEWKQFFTDTTLQSLISRGVAYNYDLQLALRRIDIAQQQVKQAKLSLLPSLSLQIAAQTSIPSKNSLNGISLNSFLGTSHIEDYNLSGSLSWEVDIWGKIRRQKEATIAQYLQTYEGAKAVQTQLVANIAQGFYNLLMLDAQMGIARRNLALSDSTLLVTRLQRDAGEVTTLAVEQAESQRLSTAVLIPQIEQAIAIQENALSVLTGENPGVISRPVSLGDLGLPESLPTGLPAAILSRRPDVRASEMALIAANAQVGVATGSLYPTLVISAQGGLNSFKASDWFSIPGSLFGNLVGGITQPIFQQRKLKTQLEIAKIQREQSVIQFKQSVLTAVGEVSDALVRVDKLRQQQSITAAQVDTLHHAIQNAQLLFRSGLANYLEVITAQASSLQAELSLADIRRQELSSVVDLYRSLGGGWK